MSNFNKGLFSSIIGRLSPTEFNLLAIIGLLESAKRTTGSERELSAINRRRRERLEMMNFKSNGSVMNDLFKLGSKLTKTEIDKLIRKYKNELLNKVDSNDGAVKETDSPDSAKYAFYSCGNCGFTIDAVKDFEDDIGSLKCPQCGGKMKGLTREEFRRNDNGGKFNTGTELKDALDTKDKKVGMEIL